MPTVSGMVCCAYPFWVIFSIILCLSEDFRGVGRARLPILTVGWWFWCLEPFFRGVGWEGAGADLAYADVNNNGIDDVIVMAYDDPNGANQFRYRIGFDVDDDGVAQKWSVVKN